MLNRIFSFDSAKAIKANKYGYLNGIHYMAPANVAGVGNLCPWSTAACRALCLGLTSSQAGMVADINNQSDQGNQVRASRAAKAQRFMRHRAMYLLDVVRSIDNARVQAARLGMQLCIRMNGSTDIAFESIRFTVGRDKSGKAIAVVLGGKYGMSIMDHYPMVQFVDYTKGYSRFDRAIPENYSLTLSFSGENEADCVAALARGINVSVVFAGSKPATWNGFPVIDGDESDLRHLDPKGVVVGLSPKGRLAAKDTSGFVVR